MKTQEKRRVGEVWGHADRDDTEEWVGAFETREEAEAAGLDFHAEDESVWVCKGQWIEPEKAIRSISMSDLYYVLEEMEDWAYHNEYPGEDQVFFLSTNTAESALKQALANWARCHLRAERWSAKENPIRVR